ncbi:major facilitator superfamily transporter [Phlyctema vagabunda]|uniref:Major facilitator superfamily transporter n=1 Tax=Phlyctema vagabunda TaxID=108571 RepID=A0ABR4P795_9HELO
MSSNDLKTDSGSYCEPAGDRDVMTTMEEKPTRKRLETVLLMSALALANLLVALDTTIATTAIPAITASLHSAAGYAWIGSAYSLATAVTVPLWAKLSDIWGRKPLLLLAISVFFVGSLLCGIARSMVWLILARALQGVGGGGISILVSICISDTFSMRERPLYFGVIGMTWSFSSATGPLLGGILTTRASWRWYFFINLPSTVLSALVVAFKIKVHTPQTRFWEGIKRIDWVGSMVMVAGALLLLLGLQMGGVDHSWKSPIILSFIICGGLLASIFILWEWKFAHYPLMPLRVLKSRTSVSALGVCCLHSMCLTGGAYFLPLYLQGVLGATPLMSGVLLLPFTISLSLTNIIAGLVIRRTDKYLLIMRVATCIMALGFGLLISLPQRYQWTKIIIFQIIAGIGIGPNFQCPLLAVQASSQQADHAAAASTFNFLNNLSASCTIVISTAIFQNSMQKQQSVLINELGVDVAELLTGQNAAANLGVIDDLPDIKRVLAHRAFLKAMLGIWIMYAVLAACSILCSLCAKDKVLVKEHKMTETGIESEELKREMEYERRRAKKEAKGVKCYNMQKQGYFGYEEKN